jgi:hypothetical protein
MSPRHIAASLHPLCAAVLTCTSFTPSCLRCCLLRPAQRPLTPHLKPPRAARAAASTRAGCSLASSFSAAGSKKLITSASTCRGSRGKHKAVSQARAEVGCTRAQLGRCCAHNLCCVLLDQDPAGSSPLTPCLTLSSWPSTERAERCRISLGAGAPTCSRGKQGQLVGSQLSLAYPGAGPAARGPRWTISAASWPPRYTACTCCTCYTCCTCCVRLPPRAQGKR